MKLIVIAALALVAVASAAPADQPPGKVVNILRSEFDQKPEGYNYNFETDDGTSRNENGELKTVNDEENKPHSVIVVRGSYNYIDTDGNSHAVEYVADETGFHAESKDIPQPPGQA